MDGLTYTWTYDTRIFNLASDLNSPNIILTPKEGIDINSIVTQITCTVRDIDNNCVEVKICYYTPQGMECSTNYIACPNAIGLRLINKVVLCNGPTLLTVTKKI